MKNEHGERENTEKLSPDLLAAITKWLCKQEEPKRAKYKANSLRAQQAIARFGKSAGHPLCLAALDLWRLDEELFALSKDVDHQAGGKLHCSTSIAFSPEHHRML
jgi:hypothetical protein